MRGDGVSLNRSKAKRMASAKCAKRNRSGKPCGAPAGASGVCAIHANPDRARELGVLGGRRNRHVPAIGPVVQFAPPKDAAAVRDVLGLVMRDVHSGALDTKVATCVVYASTALLKSVEASDLESRISKLEESINARIKKQN
jgi:hypothetical protein